MVFQIRLVISYHRNICNCCKSINDPKQIVNPTRKSYVMPNTFFKVFGQRAL